MQVSGHMSVDAPDLFSLLCVDGVLAGVEKGVCVVFPSSRNFSTDLVSGGVLGLAMRSSSLAWRGDLEGCSEVRV